MCLFRAFLQCLYDIQYNNNQFLVPPIEYALGDSSQKGSHAYFLLTVAIVLLL